MLKVELPQFEASLFPTVTVYVKVEPAVPCCEFGDMTTFGFWWLHVVGGFGHVGVIGHGFGHEPPQW